MVDVYTVRGIVTCKTTQINGNELSQRESNVGNHRHHYSDGYHAHYVRLMTVTLFICKRSDGLNALILSLA